MGVLFCIWYKCNSNCRNHFIWLYIKFHGKLCDSSNQTTIRWFQWANLEPMTDSMWNYISDVFFLLSNEEEKQNDEKSYKIHISFLFFCFVFQAWNLLATRAFIQKPLFIPFTLIVQKKSKIFKCLNKLQQHKKKTKAHKPLEERWIVSKLNEMFVVLRKKETATLANMHERTKALVIWIFEKFQKRKPIW